MIQLLSKSKLFLKTQPSRPIRMSSYLAIWHWIVHLKLRHMKFQFQGTYIITKNYNKQIYEKQILLHQKLVNSCYLALDFFHYLFYVPKYFITHILF